jgi:hypothetical protein
MRGVHYTKEGAYVRIIDNKGNFDSDKTAKTLVKFLKENYPDDYMDIAESLGTRLIPSGEGDKKEYDFEEKE